MYYKRVKFSCVFSCDRKGNGIMITIEQIQKRLAEAIKESGMKQTDIAKALNVHPTQVCSYIKGRKMPALDTFANLCKLLDVDANYILCTE